MPPTEIVEISDPAGERGLVIEAYRVLADLVAEGAALGWVDPPTLADIEAMFADIGAAVAAGDAVFCAAFESQQLVGLGYWRRYRRQTHWPHAEVRKVAVVRPRQSRGIGRALMLALIGAARRCRIEVLTLDLRGDNQIAIKLYESLGFFEYGRLKDFAAFGELRYDKVLYALDLRVPPPA